MGGRLWTIRPEGFWTQRLVVADGDGIRLLKARMRSRGASGEAEAEGRLPDAVLLLGRGFAIHLTMQMNASVVATTGATVAITAGNT